MCIIIDRQLQIDMFDSIFEDGSLRDYINQNVQDPWIGTPFQDYVFMAPKQKGEFGERFVLQAKWSCQPCGCVSIAQKLH